MSEPRRRTVTEATGDALRFILGWLLALLLLLPAMIIYITDMITTAYWRRRGGRD